MEHSARSGLKLRRTCQRDLYTPRDRETVVVFVKINFRGEGEIMSEIYSNGLI